MLKFSENSKNLGNLKIGQPHSFVINVINPTGKDVDITRVHAGCSKCTRARMDVNVVKANSSAPLSITFTPDSTGIARKTVTINDAIVFTFTAQVSN